MVLYIFVIFLVVMVVFNVFMVIIIVWEINMKNLYCKNLDNDVYMVFVVCKLVILIGVGWFFGFFY